MPLHLSWEQIALRLALASIASFVIGFNRDEHGHPAGIRTTMLVCLAATLAMLQTNLLLPTAGRPPSSFIMMDLMRLPLGILSGIGFIGAGAIIRRGTRVNGVTTAATIWFVTVLGLLFGGGNLGLGVAGSFLGFAILWALKYIERYYSRQLRGSLHLTLSPGAPNEANLRQHLLTAGWNIVRWSAHYEPASSLAVLDCDLNWRARASRVPETPPSIEQLGTLPGILTMGWRE